MMELDEDFEGFFCCWAGCLEFYFYCYYYCCFSFSLSISSRNSLSISSSESSYCGFYFYEDSSGFCRSRHSKTLLIKSSFDKSSSTPLIIFFKRSRFWYWGSRHKNFSRLSFVYLPNTHTNPISFSTSKKFSLSIISTSFCFFLVFTT